MNAVKESSVAADLAAYVESTDNFNEVLPGEEGEEKSLGYFLICDGPDGGSNVSSWSCQATAVLRVIPVSVKQGTDPVSKEVSRLFSSKSNGWGYNNFMTWDNVKNPERGLIEGDSVNFLVLVAADEPLRCERCEERACKVCMKDEVCILFHPCGHLATCTKCSSNLKECPICRGKINMKIRAYV